MKPRLSKIGTSSVIDFYEGKSVFLTGATGFLGKAMLQKLLASCENLKFVYILIRSKKGFAVDNRINELFESPIFDKLRSTNPDAFDKVIPIPGDILEPALGLSDDDRLTLIRNVSIVIHSAASVKFNEPLEHALKCNLGGTKKVLELCKEMPILEALVHISTAYANCDLKHIPEEVVTEKRDSIGNAVSGNGKIGSNVDTEKGIGNKPNTYTFAKAKAEEFLLQECGEIRTAIVRPSIISASWSEPFPGFVDNLCGVSGIIAATGNGLLTSLCCDPDKISDIIPLDIVANLAITAAWDVHENRLEKNSSVTVYNCCSGTSNPIKNQEVQDYCIDIYKEFPYTNAFRKPIMHLTKRLPVFHTLNFLLTYIPCFLFDLISIVRKRKLRMTKIYEKMIQSVRSYTFFHLNEWSFEEGNIPKLIRKLSPQDQEIFLVDVEKVNWQEYFRNHVYGVKKWVLREKC